jgi:hypothetical protein
MVRFFLYYSSSMAQETTKRRRSWTNDQLKAAIAKLRLVSLEEPCIGL